MKEYCPKCLKAAEISKGRFRDLTNARFDTDYADGILGMANGVKIICAECGEFNLFLKDWNALISNDISATEITRFQNTYPTFQGVIPLSTWLESTN
jgi:hypothetical protein